MILLLLSNVIVIAISSSNNDSSLNLLKSSFQQEINNTENEDPLKNNAKFQSSFQDNLSLLNNNSTNLQDSTGNISIVNKVNISSLPPYIPPKNIIEMPEHKLDPEDFAKAKKEAETVKPNTTVSEISLPQLVQNSTLSSNLTKNVSVSKAIKFNGFNGLDENTGRAYPPDVQVASGTNHVLEMVNLAVQIFTKGGNILQTSGLKQFFQVGNDFISDPKVLFDAESKRWFSSIVDVTTGSIVVGVSITDDPMGLWNFYNIPFGNPSGTACPDQPIIGINNDKFVISANLFSTGCTQPFLGVQYVIVDKQDLLDGITPPRSQQSSIDNTIFSVHPVRSLTDTPILYMVSVYSRGSNNVVVYSLSGSVPNVVSQIAYHPIQLTNMPPDAIQPGGTVRLETNDARVLDAIFANENIWFTFNDGCLPSGDTQARSCFRLVNIDTTATTNAVKQDFDVGAPNSYLFFPSIHLDSSGNLNILFGYASSTFFPSLAITYRSISDPNNTIRPAVGLIQGTGINNDGRYGDYFGSGIDPVSPSYNWLAGQYQDSNGWRTFIANVTSTIPIKLSTDLAVANQDRFPNDPNDVSILLGNGDGTFGTATNFGAGEQSTYVTVGLFSHDKFLDLAVVNQRSNDVSILLGNGDGTFGAATNFGVGTNPLSVAVGPFNGDTFLDLAVANVNSNDVSILLGHGDGTFGAATNFGAGTNPRSVAVGLFNGDPFMDLAVANVNSDDVSILLGNGDGTFGTATNFGAGTRPTYVAVDLFNDDKFLDLAVANELSDDVSILLGNGDGTFGAATNFRTGDGPRSVAVGLFNCDPFMDLAAANSNSVTISILLGNGDGTFGTATNFTAGTWPLSVAVSDFNDDTFLDLAVANVGSDNVSILLGNGDGTFGAATNFGAGNGPRSVAVGEFNGS